MTGSLNRYASVAHNSTLDITEAITIAAWIKPNGINRKRILSKSGPDGYEFSISENGKLEFRFNRESSGTEYLLYSSSDYSSDGETWMHVAVTFDGTTSKFMSMEWKIIQHLISLLQLIQIQQSFRLVLNMGIIDGMVILTK